MQSSKIFLLLGLWAFVSPIFSQEPFPVDTTRRCLYSGRFFDGSLRQYKGTDKQMELMLDTICAIADAPRNFTVVIANVPTVAAVISGEQAFLLYSRSYFYKIRRENRALAYALLAHEVGHILHKHKLTDALRIREETEADVFVGRVLMRVGGTKNKEAALKLLENEPFSYSAQAPWKERAEAILRGWGTANALMKGLGFGNDPNDVEHSPLPRLILKDCATPPWPVPASKFTGCDNLQAINERLCNALSKQGYDSRGYYAVKNGFALVTGLEQYKVATGTFISGNARWQVCPAKDRFDGLIDYITSLVYPQPSNFRLFVFVVTNQAVLQYEPGCVSADEGKQWLSKGGTFLPESIGSKSAKGYVVNTLVYEFVVPDTGKKFKTECSRDGNKSKWHLEKAGILAAIKR